MSLRESIRNRVAYLKREILILGRALKDPRTPWYARTVIWLTVGYALSPIDLIPDFIPVLGYLDDIIIVPAGICLARRLIPRHILEELRAELT